MRLLISHLLGTIVVTVLLFGTVALLDYSRVAQAQSEDFGYTVRIRPHNLSDADLAKALDTAKRAGVNTVDFEVGWAWTDKGDYGGETRTYYWSQSDRIVEAAEARGMNITFLLTSTPDWVHPNLKSTQPDANKRHWTAPKGATELQHWSNFVSDVVDRYKGRVSHYEMWNEPNHPQFWQPAPNPAEYAALQRAGYLSAKKTDPDTKVVSAGLSGNDFGYLSEYYTEVKTSYPDAASNDYFFDTLGVHPYSQERSPDFTQAASNSEIDPNFLGFKKMKQTMNEQGDLGKNLWLSEYGFSTTDTWMKAVPDDKRALYLKRAYELARETPYVKGLSWYAYNPGVSDPPEWTLLKQDLKPSLTFRAYEQVTGAQASNVGITISLPESVSGTRSVDPQLANLSGSDVSRWELWVDGKLVKEQPTTPIIWDTRGVSVGDHKVMVAAYTNDGSVWHSNIVNTNIVNTSVDYVAPTVDRLSPSPSSATRDRTPTIRATVKDNLTDLSKRNIKLYVDGRRRGTFRYNQSTNNLTYTTGRLAYKHHKVKIVARDAAGNVAERSWLFKVVR